MDIVMHYLVLFSHYLRDHLDKVALSLVATAIFLYGEEIHGLVKRQIQGLALVLRVMILIVVCAVGYGALTVGCTFLCRKLLGFMDDNYLAPVVLGLFLLIGILAEKRKAV